MRINKQKDLPLKVAGYIFGIIAIAHLLRLVYNLEITFAGYIVPMSISYIALIVTLLLSIWMFKARHTNNKRGF